MKRYAFHKSTNLSAYNAAIAAAVETLNNDQLVALPTETVYGLAANACSTKAVQKIYDLKKRPSINPLIVHVATWEMAKKYGKLPESAERLAEAFWPGALTLVVPRQTDSPLSSRVTAELDTVALRMPSLPAIDLIAACGYPLAAPSANRSGWISTTTADAVMAEFGDAIDVILDGGDCTIGLESTIIGLYDTQPYLLRPGGIARTDIEAVLGDVLVHPVASFDNAPQAPGMLTSHYAPRARLRLHVQLLMPGEALLSFGNVHIEQEEKAIASENLSPTGDLNEAAARLFAALRRLDASGASVIAVAPIPKTGLGEAICDRLMRAAAPRDKK